MTEHFKQIVRNQFEAALCMLNRCIDACPAELWEAKIANGTFRWVAYHTLFYVDYYLARGDADFKPRELHARGGTELSDAAAAGLSRDETLEYLKILRAEVHGRLAADTAESLEADSGFGRKMSRAEMHLYNIRHIQHHAGQLSAFLRRMTPETVGMRALPWVGSGWRE